MKLTTQQIEDAVLKLQVSAISESAGLMAELVDLYGDHTFFVDPDGLHILERLDEDQQGDDREFLTLIQIAAWTDETRSEVATHDPRMTGKTVIMGSGPPDTAA